MEIIVNGKTEHISENLSIKDYLQLKNITSGEVVVELNRNIIKREEWKGTILQSGDQLELVRLVGGG